MRVSKKKKKYLPSSIIFDTLNQGHLAFLHSNYQRKNK